MTGNDIRKLAEKEISRKLRVHHGWEDNGGGAIQTHPSVKIRRGLDYYTAWPLNAMKRMVTRTRNREGTYQSSFHGDNFVINGDVHITYQILEQNKTKVTR